MKEENKKKLLIVCPVCERKGFKEVIAEVEDEDVLVLRFKGAFTRVRGANFALMCGRCDEVVFTRNEL